LRLSDIFNVESNIRSCKLCIIQSKRIRTKMDELACEAPVVIPFKLVLTKL